MGKVLYNKNFCQTEANKYLTKKAFREGSPGAYAWAYNHGILDEICINLKSGWQQWTLDLVKQEALKYTKKNDFKKGSPKAYSWAYLYNHLDVICGHMTRRLTWNDKEAFNEGRKFTNKTDFYQQSPSSYDYCKRKGILNKVCAHMTKKINEKYKHQDKKECHKIALKYSYRTAWAKAEPTSYKYASRNGWLPELTKHMSDPYQAHRKHTLETCKQKAKPYTLISEFRKHEKAAYIATITNGWKKEVMGHLLTKTQAIKKGLLKKVFKHTKEDCQSKASLCSTRNEFFTKFGSHHYTATKAGFLDEICANMRPTSELLSESLSKSSASEVIELVLTNNYSRQELKKARPDLMKYIYRHGIINEVPFKATNFNKWNKENTELAVNQFGLKNKNPYLQFKFSKLVESKSKEGKRRVSVETINLKTKQVATSGLSTILQGQNPFTKLHKQSPIYVQDLIDNKLGVKSKNIKEHFKFVSIKKYPIVTIKSLYTKELKNISIFQLKLKVSNPFSIDRFRSDTLYKIQINELGVKSKHPEEHFEFISKKSIKSKGKPRIRVKIRNLHNKKTKDVLSNSLFFGRNPFTIKYDYHEVEKVQPIVKKFLLGLGLKIMPEDMVKWKDRTRPDMIFSNKNNKKIVIEVKSWKKIWMQKDIDKQISGYKKVGKKSFGNNYALCQTVCLKGKYGITLKQIEQLLKSRGLI